MVCKHRVLHCGTCASVHLHDRRCRVLFNSFLRVYRPGGVGKLSLPAVNGTRETVSLVLVSRDNLSLFLYLAQWVSGAGSGWRTKG